MESQARLLVGLGNPPSSYQFTRHNVGRLFVAHLLNESGASFSKTRQAEFFRLPNFFGVELDKPLVCAQLNCYMNESGSMLKGLMDKEHILPQETIVVFDEFMLPFGSLRYREVGSAGGHNGIKSILEHLGTDEFGRLRIGIGHGPGVPPQNFADFVLKNFSSDEKKKLPGIFKAAQEGVSILLNEGVSKGQNFLNRQHL